LNHYSIYSAGNFITTNHTLGIHNPYDHSLVATTYLADETILEKAIAKALSIKEELQKDSMREIILFNKNPCSLHYNHLSN
jgi:hypothetical protein